MDMRTVNYINKYDIILNLFTSFGYFDNDKDHKLVFQNIYKALKNKGYLLLILNAKKILKTYQTTY